jgi:hypothetical protein
VVDEFEFLFQATQVATVLSEDHGYWIDYSATYRARRVLLEFGRRFAAAGALAAAQDVVHLTLDETRQTATALPGLDRQALVAERKAEIERFRAIQPPAALGVPPTEAPPDNPLTRAMTKFFGGPLQESDDPSLLKGNAGSSGTVRGTARVIRSLAEAVLLAGLAGVLSQQRRLEPAVSVALGGALVVGAVLFWRHERRHPDALLRPDRFRRRAFAAANAVVGLGNLATYVTLLAIPLYLASVLGASGATIGLLLAPLSVAMVLCARGWR